MKKAIFITVKTLLLLLAIALFPFYIVGLALGMPFNLVMELAEAWKC